jgi:hypothetical protein
VEIIEARKRAGQICLDEFQYAAPGFKADLDENPRALADVVARCLHEPRRLTQFRDYAPRAIRFRGVIEQCLARQTCPERIGIHLWIPFPAADGLQLVHSRLDIGADDWVLHLLGGRERRGIDLLKTAAEPGESANVRVDRRPTQVLEQIVMNVNAVRARLAGQDFI